jgi:hypothetical protein
VAHGDVLSMLQLPFIRTKYLTGPASPLPLMWLPRRMASLDDRFSGGVLLSHAEMVEKLQEGENVRQNKRITELSKPPEARECDALDLHDHPTHSLAKTGEAFRAAAKAPKYIEKAAHSPSGSKRKRTCDGQPYILIFRLDYYQDKSGPQYDCNLRVPPPRKS